MAIPHEALIALHQSIINSASAQIIAKVREMYGEYGKGLLQVFFPDPPGYKGGAHFIFFPESMDASGLLSQQPYPGPGTHEALFNFDATRTFAVCITCGDESSFYHIELPLEAEPFALRSLN